MLIRNGLSINSEPLSLAGINWQCFMTDHGAHSFSVDGLGTKTAYPNGYYPSAAMIPAITAGNMASIGKLVSASTVSLTMNKGVAISAGLTSTSALTALAALIVSASADLTSTSTLSGTALGAGNLTAGLTSSSVLAALASALGNMQAGVTSGSTLSGTPSAIGSMAANITSSSVLSPESLSVQLLDIELVEIGMTVRQALKLIAAATAGQASGSPSGPIAFKSAVAADKTRISATVDGSGNRTAITYDLT